MKMWLPGWRKSDSNDSGNHDVRNNKIYYKLLMDQTDVHHQFGGNKVKLMTQSQNDDEEATYKIECDNLMDENPHVSIN